MTQIIQQDPNSYLRNLSATRIEVSTVGVIGGVISIEHGYFETLQGNISTNGILINAIGPANRFWEGGSERALTIIPNFLITGISAMIVGILIIMWSIAFVQRKYGGLGLFILSIISLLVGGGIAFLILGILNSITATRINKPLKLWRKLLPAKIRPFLTKLWLYSLISAEILFILAMLMGIFGVPFLDSNTATDFIWFIGYFSLGLTLFTIIAGFAYDIQKQTDSHHSIEKD